MEKFHGIAQAMPNFYMFNAVVGFFRSSGWFRLRTELENVARIQILIGINIDNIFRNRNPNLLFHEITNECRMTNIFVIFVTV